MYIYMYIYLSCRFTDGEQYFDELDNFDWDSALEHIDIWDAFVFLDLSKAFYMVSIPAIENALFELGVCGPLLKLIQFYLRNRVTCDS